jgi:shikimate 5-dehydrogenase
VPVGDFDLVVNATVVGMGAGGPDAAGDGSSSASTEAPANLKSLPLDADALGETHRLVDLAYGAVETELVRAARARGARVVDGLEVLVRQGAVSLRIWTGRDPPIEAMRRAARANEWQPKNDPNT